MPSGGTETVKKTSRAFHDAAVQIRTDQPDYTSIINAFL